MSLLLLALVCSLLWAPSTNALLTEEEEARIEDFVNELLECTRIPGLSLAAVRNGEVELALGYGKADIDEDIDVTGETLFNIGSTSKAFVGVLLAQLLEEHETYNWNTPARDIVGDSLYFSDGFRTNVTTLRDLLAHKMGVPRHDYMWIFDQWSNDELVERIRFFEPVQPYRTLFMYNNLMYGVAGHAAVALSGGETWELLTQERIFNPLQMSDTTFIHEAGPEYESFATPYIETEQGLEIVPWEFYNGVRSVPAAGSIASSAQDMAKWLNFLLGHAQVTDPPLESEVAVQTFLPEFVTNTPGFSKPTFDETLDWLGVYSRAWFDGYYKGYRTISHGGDYTGYHSYVSLLPDMDIGVYTSMNKPDNGIQRMWLHAFVMDVLLGEDQWFNASDVCSWTPSGEDVVFWDLPPHGRSQASHNPRKARRNEFQQQLEDFTGTYGNFGYGNVSIFLDDSEENLQLTYGNNGFYTLVSTEDEYEFDTYGNNAVSELVDLERVYFETSNGDGSVTSVTIPRLEGFDPPIFIRDLQYDDAPPPSLDGCAP